MKNALPPKLTKFIEQLKAAHIHYDLACIRSGAILVEIAVPGEHIEAEFFDDGSVEIERFVSNGEIGDWNELNTVIAKYSGVRTCKRRVLRDQLKSAVSTKKNRAVHV